MTQDGEREDTASVRLFAAVTDVTSRRKSYSPKKQVEGINGAADLMGITNGKNNQDNSNKKISEREHLTAKNKM